MANVLVTKSGVKFAASKASPTTLGVNSLTADQVAEGALGLFGVDQTSQKKASVVSSAMTAGTGEILASAVAKTDLVQFVLGTVDGFIQGTGLQVNGIRRVAKKAYEAPIRNVLIVGYNGDSGSSMNLPTLVTNDEAIIRVTRILDGTNDRDRKNYTSGSLLSTDTGYIVAQKLIENINNTLTRRHNGYITSDGTLADFAGTATHILLTKNSKTAAFVVPDATGFVASTGNTTLGDLIGIAHSNMTSVTFTALILGTGAGRHIVTINGTVYNVADAGSAAQNATAIAAAINAGTQATATVSTADVTVVVNKDISKAHITVTSTADDATFANVALTVNSTTGDTLPVRLKSATATATGIASITLDEPWMGETGYWIGSTDATIGIGVVSSATVYGVKLDGLYDYDDYDLSVDGVLENATHKKAVLPTRGSGTYDHVLFLEKQELPYRGAIDQLDATKINPTTLAVVGKRYDLYFIDITNFIQFTGTLDEDKQPIHFIIAVDNATPVADMETPIEDIFSQLGWTLETMTF